MNNPITIGRRRFLGRAAAALAGASVVTPVGLTTALAAPAETAPASTLDATLLALEERIFQHKEAAEAFEPEMDRLDAIVKEEYRRLCDEAWAAGTVNETHDARLEQLSAMPEHVEQCRLCELQDAHWRAVDELVGKMWNIPAQTPEGRQSKLSVLLACILGEEWRHPDSDDRTSYEILRARGLLIELVGGEPSRQLRDQFV